MRQLSLGQPFNDTDEAFRTWAEEALREIERASYEGDEDAIASGDLPVPADASPLPDGTADVGSSTKYAREDHVHPRDAGVVRHDVAQDLTAAQQAQARTNIGAQPMGNYQPPLGYTPVNRAGDTMTGDLTIYRAGAPNTGVVFLGNSGARYLYFDGSNYYIPGAHIQGAAGRLLGTSADAGLVINGRLAYAADASYSNNGSAEPYNGAVITGLGASSNVYGIIAVWVRYRYLQLQNLAGGWWTIGYA
ncbi:hypothetical protein I6F35_33750 [Bradyrhizobium sp. BRP22]|uniref:hypothetical protein n=1 Tax=Bradyrhizobium sp. BRP22 TaxID=2793821 RepID=UPI001CD3CDF0|nr:hypothetical protein [Bradyrhizobium sp. BRP22]MCA1458101.1 hypothetical protein [Bradyrhizobium sp. BRP22]